MNVQPNKNFFKKVISLAGVAGASIFMSLPAIAQAAPNNSINQSLNPSQSEQLLAQNRRDQDRNLDGRSFICDGYLGNPTTGGGFYCSTQFQQFLRRSDSARGMGGTYPETMTTPQGRDTMMNRDSMNTPAGAGYPGTNVTPQGPTNMNR